MNKVTILDGGMGRELKRIGAPFSQPLWSAQALIESPHYVKQAHQGFIDAGAEVITVNSYACVPFHLGEELYASRGKELAKSAAQIAREVVDCSGKNVVVAGSLPPPLGSYRPDLFEEAKAHEISSLLFQAQDQYVDVWLAETVSSLAEAKVVLDVFSQTDRPYFVAFTLMDEVNQPARLRSGESVSSAVELLLSSEAKGIFFNCSIPEVIEQAIKAVNNVVGLLERELAIGVFANSFTPINTSHEANNTVQALRHFSPQEYLEFAKTWHSLGASIIGGCCGIEPSHIEVLSAWRDGMEES